MIGHSPLSIAKLLHGFPDHPIPFGSLTEYTALKQFLKSRPGSIPLALRNLRHALVASNAVSLSKPERKVNLFK
jgi:hypothetical protein